MLAYEVILSSILVYFVYGLAFFSMGLALLLETGRSPRLAEKRVLQPLALFGLLHGTYEWLDIFLLQAGWVNVPMPEWFAWLRFIWLAASFLPLLLFGFLGLNQRRLLRYFEIYAVGISAFFLIFLTLVGLYTNLPAGGALVRYLIAIPGAVLAALVLISRSRGLIQEGRQQISRCFLQAGFGFVLYASSQIFVPAADIFPAAFVNDAVFLEAIGIPVQAIRAGLAVLITINLLSAVQLAEHERSEQLLAAQQERLQAMERVQEELINREVMRRELLRHIVTAQEDERARIARELHDETAQILTAISLDLATLRTLAKRRKHEMELIDRLLNLGRQMSRGLYRLVHDLRPAQLDDLGLVPALQHLADEMKHSTGLLVEMAVSGQRERLDSILETVIFRVAQEALTNVARHSRAASANLLLEYAPGDVTLLIRDEGQGFDPDRELLPPHGWGLAGMRERAESVGGCLEIRSAPLVGTEIKMVIPLLLAAGANGKELAYGNPGNPIDVGR
jgi:signal transduction histidine kinase